MHPNPSFRKEPDTRNIGFVRDRGFGTLAINGDDGPLTAHVPVLLDPDGARAELHLMRSNPIARACTQPQKAVVTVTGPDSYISPDWYGVIDQVPTWNYVAVRITGTLTLMPKDGLHPMLDRLSAHFEDHLKPKTPWTSAKMSDGVMERMMRAIQPFRFDVTGIHGTWKLGQNKPDDVRRAAADHVAAYGIGQEIETLAALMHGATPETEMRLYSSPTSPYVRKVLVLLQETGQLADVEMIPAGGTPVDPGTMPRDLNPLGKIPVLVLPNEDAIFDSRVICRYLDTRANSGLYGTGDQGWQLATLEATADGILDAAILTVYEARVRPTEKQWDGWVEAQWAKISGALDMIEAQWMGLLPNDLQNIGQIAVGCALGYLDLRHPDRNWRDGRPKLAAWDAEFAKRDSMQATVPPTG